MRRGSVDSRTLKIIEEDILRVLEERGEKIPQDIVRYEVRASLSAVSQAINSLRRKGLIREDKDYLKLTRKGRKKGRDLLRKHLILERYFRGERNENESEAHKKAHILEHYVSEGALREIRKLSTLRGEGVPLVEFDSDREGIITDISALDDKTFERMVSMGIFLGRRIKVADAIPDIIIVRLGKKKLALDNGVAEKIKVAEI